jgi:hypothetical protein
MKKISEKSEKKVLVKLNIDGAYNERSVRSEVLRNSYGEWIRGFSKFLGTYSSYVLAELWGMFRMIEIYLEVGIS